MSLSLKNSEENKNLTKAKVITIDGPSGVGKGSVSSIIAKKLQWRLLDSGALYRLTALASLKAGVDLDAQLSDDVIEKIAEIAENLNIEFDYKGALVETILNGENVSSQIRTEDMGAFASKVAGLTLVRQALLKRQRSFLQAPGLVCDGRDMGTVIFPDADLKIYLTASAQIRAQRRYKQLQNSDKDANISRFLAQIEARDKADMERKDSPLKPADDAKIIDTGDLSIEQVVQTIESYFSEARILN